MIQKYQEQMIHSLQRLIGFPSIKYDGLSEEEYTVTQGAPFGNHIKNALEDTLALCRELGFRTKNCDGYVGFAEYGEGKEMMAILTHLDVVPEGNDWTYPPFGGEVHEGKLFGRGAIDDKGPAIAAIYALKSVVDSGAVFHKRVRLIFGVDEEKTWKDMEYYVKHEEQPTFGFTPDARFPVVYCEKELLHCDFVKSFPKFGRPWTLTGGVANNAVPDFCQLEWTDEHGNLQRLTQKGVSAHGSRPEEGVNAVSLLMKRLKQQMEAGQTLCTPELAECVCFYDACIGDRLDGARLGIDVQDDISGGTTLNMGKIRANEKECRLSVDIRMPLVITKDTVLQNIQDRIGKYGFVIENVTSFPAVYCEKESAFLKTLIRIYQRFTNDMTEPILMGGGTYARAIKNIIAFGPRFPGREETEHQKNEYILLEDLMKGAEIYAAAIQELATDATVNGSYE